MLADDIDAFFRFFKRRVQHARSLCAPGEVSAHMEPEPRAARRALPGGGRGRAPPLRTRATASFWSMVGRPFPWLSV
jgi:hypothetical protein